MIGKLTPDDILRIWKMELNGVPRIEARRSMGISYLTHEYWLSKMYTLAYFTKVSPKKYELAR
jgi:hypothetical protein